MKQLITTVIILQSILFQTKAQYFQQEVNTTIDVTLDDKNHLLKAFETIEYINNSPDTLSFIYMHLWPNAYKDNKTALARQLNETEDFVLRYSPKDNRGYIDSLDFRVGNISLKQEYDNNKDYVKLILPIPLAPGEKINITTPFRVKIPYGNISRLGHMGQAYQITQWFPKPAVYDQNGWNVMPYLTQGEFYSEYGSYDVKITLPENYVVGATGDLVNGEKELKWLEQKDAETRKIIEQGDYSMLSTKTPESAAKTKTLHYYQDNVHDFAWFADKRWRVLKSEVELPYSKRKVTTWSMFTDNEFELWEKAPEYIDSAVYYYSLWVGEYPYNQVTAVDGALTAGAGMEYPNVTVIGESHTASLLEQVIVHEVGHNWFYGILGSNERKHAWMDEGMNTFIENRTTEALHPGAGINLLSKKTSKQIGIDRYGARGIHDLSYLLNARRGFDQPIETPAEDFTSTNYGAIVYSKTGIGFDYLLAYLGDSLMDKCMQTYFDEWKFKHPQPQNVEEVFERVTQKDLDWFFKDYIRTSKKIDYKIASYSPKRKTITIVNKTGFKAPVSYAVVDDSNRIVRQEWIDGFEGKKTIEIPETSFNKIVLDFNRDIPEIDRTDDVVKSSGICKTCRPLKLKFIGEIENREYNTINYLPLVAWNENDRFMLGATFYNTTFPAKKIEWIFTPLYSFRNNYLNGIGVIDYNIHPQKIFREITLGASAKTFSYDYFLGDEQPPNTKWYRSDFHLKMELKNKDLRRSPRQIIKLSHVSIKDFTTSDFLNVNYEIGNRQVLKHKSVKLHYVWGNKGTMSTLSATAKARFNFNLGDDAFYVRLFAGKTLVSDPSTTRYNWRTSGQTGLYDYQYDNIFLGRTASYPNFLAQQLGNSHGGFKTYTLSGSSDKWLLAFNFKTSIPYLPFGLFADVSYYPYKVITGGVSQDKTGSLYGVGIWLPLVKNYIDVYIPLLLSSEIVKEYDYRGVNFWQSITFSINFHSMNPFRIIREIKP